MRPRTIEKFPPPRPSFAGNAVLVLIAFAIIVAVAAVLTPILRDACAFGCPL